MRKTKLGCTILEGHDIADLPLVSENAEILENELEKKVDKVTGKGLSTNDYTTTEKNKLAGIEAGANKYIHPSTHPANIITENENRRFVSDVEKANWNSKETPEGAQAKANAAASSALVAANSHTDQEVGALAGEGNVKTVKQLDDDLAAHKAENASTSKKGHVQLTSSTGSTSTTLGATASAVKAAMDRANEAFQSASDGKQKIATAITGKGVPTSSSATFNTMANNINAIETGDYSIGDMLDSSKYIGPKEQIWSFNSNPFSLAVDNNSNVYIGAYIGGSYGMVKKISSNGKEIWSFDNNGTLWTAYSVAVDANGYVYVGSGRGDVTKISPSGSRIWNFTDHADTVNSVAVDNSGNVYSGGKDQSVRKISSSGSQIWSFTGHYRSVVSVAVDNNGNVYSGGEDNVLRKLDSNGKQIWELRHGSTVKSIAVDNNGNVYSGGQDNKVKKISPSGNEIWSFTDHADTVYSVAVDNNGNVYSGGGDKTIRKINPSGSQVWSITRNKSVEILAIDNKGFFYTSTNDTTSGVEKIIEDIKIIA